MIPHELLWQSWPLGYVPIRGVATVGSYICVWAEPDNVAFDDPHEYHRTLYPVRAASILKADATRKLHEEEQRVIAKGVLLPNVDPSDTATWACLLRDLAEAADSTEYITSGALVYGGASWSRRSSPGGSWWELVIQLWDGSSPPPSVPGPMFEQKHHFTIDTEDPALALVRARIQLREREVDHG